MTPGKKKILIVEDEPDFRTLIRDVLEDKGFDITEAANGTEGLRLYASFQPDLVLLDVRLPDMDGFDICRRIRKDGPRKDTPVIMCTVNSELTPINTGLNSGATDYILKPFETEDLIARVRDALGLGE